MLEVLRAQDPDVDDPAAPTNVGSQVGDELFENAGLALLFALILVFVYVMLRFRWKLAVGAIVATVHDVLVTTGIFALAGWHVRPHGARLDPRRARLLDQRHDRRLRPHSRQLPLDAPRHARRRSSTRP